MNFENMSKNSLEEMKKQINHALRVKGNLKAGIYSIEDRRTFKREIVIVGNQQHIILNLSGNISWCSNVSMDLFYKISTAKRMDIMNVCFYYDVIDQAIKSYNKGDKK